MTNDRMKRIAARMRDTVQESDLADALAALDAQGGFGKLSYQEQATFLLAHIGGAEDDRPAPTERSHVTPIGDGIGVKPLGSPDPAKLGRETQRFVDSLNDNQRSALLALAEMALEYRGGGIVPTSRFTTGATGAALERRGLVEWRSTPHKGYKLTERGQAVVDALNSPPYRRI